MSKTSLKVKFAAGLIMLGFLFIIGILIAEISCRMNVEYARAGFQYDENLIWRLNRNLEATKHWGMNKGGKPPFQLRFNKYGFRGENFVKNKKKDTKRIMFLGDSYTAGLDYPEAEIFCNIAVRELSKNGQKYEALNASCPAWSTDQEYLYWKTEGKNFDPDYLLLMVSPNDIREAFNKRLVELDDQQNIKINLVDIPKKERFYWRLANLSSLFQKLQKEYFIKDFGNFNRVFYFYPINYGKEDKDDWDLPIYLADPFEEVKESYALFEKLIVALKEETDKNGTKLLLSINPSTTEFNGNLDDPKYEAGIVAKHLGEIAAANNIPYLNMYDVLSEEEDPMTIFMSWEFHYDDDGHEWIGEQLAKFLEEQGL